MFFISFPILRQRQKILMQLWDVYVKIQETGNLMIYNLVKLNLGYKVICTSKDISLFLLVEILSSLEKYSEYVLI